MTTLTRLCNAKEFWDYYKYVHNIVYTHVHPHTFIPITRTHTQVHTLAHTHNTHDTQHTNTHTTHTHTHKHTQIHTHTHKHTHTNTYKHTHTHKHTHTNTHTHTYTQTHTHTHTHKHTQYRQQHIISVQCNTTSVCCQPTDIKGITTSQGFNTGKWLNNTPPNQQLAGSDPNI